MEGDTIMLQELFTYQREGKDGDGHTVGHFMQTGIRPRFADQVKHSSGEVETKAFDYLRS